MCKYINLLYVYYLHQHVYNAFRFSSELDVYAHLKLDDDEDDYEYDEKVYENVYKREKTPQYYYTIEEEDTAESLDIFNHDPSNYFTAMSKAVYCLFD